MRYSVISKGLTITELETETRRCGGSNLKVASASKQVFCDLDDTGLVRLRITPGLTVKKIGKISTDINIPSITPIPPPTLIGMPVYGAAQAGLASGFYEFRNAFDPPLVGARSTLAILDSGVRKTHEGLISKFVYEANFSDSPTCEDIYDHGCISEDAHIITSHCGIQTIRKLYEDLEEQYGASDGVVSIPDNKPIYTIGFGVNGRVNHKIELDPIKKTFHSPQESRQADKSIRTRVHQVHKIKVVGDVYRIKTCTGEILVTPWHPCLTRHPSGNFYYRRADEIREGLQLMRANYPIGVTNEYREIYIRYNLPSYGEKEETIPLNEELGYILGLIVADGHITDYAVNNNIRISCGNKKEAKIISEASSILGKARCHKSRTCWTVELGSRAWAIVVAAGLPKGDKSHIVDVPELIGKSPASVQLAFLAGEIDGDGSFSKRTLRIVTASESLASSLTYLINSLGGRAYKSVRDDNRNIVKTNILPGRKQVILNSTTKRFEVTSSQEQHRYVKGGRRVYVVHLNGTSLRVFGEWLGPYLKLKQLPIPNYGRRANYTAVRMVSLVEKEKYDGYFYDLTTDTENYLAGKGDLFIIHNTGVTYLVCGGTNGPGEESGITPGAYFMNIKVLNDIGVGTEESAVLGIEHVIELREQAVQQGLSPSDPLYPSGLNMSWGAPDDGDPDNPIRVACRALPEHGLLAFASAGNDGPNPGTITVPACEPLPAVVAVGVATISPFEITDYSSRGPTKEGLIKPDLVFFGHRLLTASSKSDTAYTVKSGTSFAAPGAAGAANLGAELLMRILGRELVDVPEGIALIKENLMKYVAKPAGMPAGQDNTYGYGLPAGNLILGEVRMAGLDISPIFGILAMGMLAGMVKGMK